MSEFNDFFKLIAEGKQDYKENDPVGKRLEEVKHNIKGDLSLLFGQLGKAKVNALHKINAILGESLISFKDYLASF